MQYCTQSRASISLWSAVNRTFEQCFVAETRSIPPARPTDYDKALELHGGCDVRKGRGLCGNSILLEKHCYRVKDGFLSVQLLRIE